MLARSLQREEVPTLAREPRKTDWRLAVSADAAKAIRWCRVTRFSIRPGMNRARSTAPPFQPRVGRRARRGLWAEATQDAVPKVLSLMMSVRATRDRANPNSLLNRIAKVYVPEVTGAPGDGNVALTRLIRSDLARVRAAGSGHARGRRFHRQRDGRGLAAAERPAAGRDRLDGDKAERRGGRQGVAVEQRAGGVASLTWGDVATVVAQQASGGINAVVERFIGRDPGRTRHDPKPK